METEWNDRVLRHCNDMDMQAVVASMWVYMHNVMMEDNRCHHKMARKFVNSLECRQADVLLPVAFLFSFSPFPDVPSLFAAGDASF